MLHRLVMDHLPKGPRRWVVWISDPKSAIAFANLRDIPVSRLVRVFDAYDAWDLSPLVRGRTRRRAVLSGYEQAARYADIIFANTEFMAGRMRDLGATDVSVIPNASPRVNAAATDPGRSPDRQPYLLYVGRIHERLDAGLLASVADAFPRVQIRLIGPVERIPNGWAGAHRSAQRLARTACRRRTAPWHPHRCRSVALAAPRRRLHAKPGCDEGLGCTRRGHTGGRDAAAAGRGLAGRLGAHRRRIATLCRRRPVGSTWRSRALPRISHPTRKRERLGRRAVTAVRASRAGVRPVTTALQPRSSSTTAHPTSWPVSTR